MRRCGFGALARDTVTGVYRPAAALGAKRLQLLHATVSRAATVLLCMLLRADELIQ